MVPASAARPAQESALATGLDQRSKRDMQAALEARALEPGKQSDAYQLKRELDQMEDGKELAPEAAQNLQAKMGNQAINSMIAKNNGTEQQGPELEIEEEGQEVEEELPDQEEEGRETEEQRSSYGGSGGGGAGGGAGGQNPWDLEALFGGEDDGDGGTRPRRRRMRPSAIRNFPGMGAQDLLPEKQAGDLESEDLSGIDALLGALGMPARPERWGDAVYQATEVALADPRRIGRRTAIEPEDLVDRTGLLDPIGRPAEIGRFLSEAGDGLLARSLARVLAGPCSALLPPATGHAGAAARLASLAVSACALEGGGQDTDRAVSLALRRDAWPDALAIAQELGAGGNLFAPAIAEGVLGGKGTILPDDEPEPASHLGGRALERVVPEGPRIHVPELDLCPTRTVDEDARVAALDDMLERLMGGDPDAARDPLLTAEALAPVLSAATALVGALGRAQVEVAAAGVAVRRVSPRAPVQPILERADQVLRQLARGVVRDGRRLEKLVGTPVEQAAAIVPGPLVDLKNASNNLHELRVWAFANLASAVNS